MAWTICGRSSRASISSSMGTQMMPLVWRIMNATASGVARSAAMIRSPSFSRSSSSTMTTIRPAFMSATISSTVLNPVAVPASEGPDAPPEVPEPGTPGPLPMGKTFAMGVPKNRLSCRQYTDFFGNGRQDPPYTSIQSGVASRPART